MGVSEIAKDKTNENKPRGRRQRSESPRGNITAPPEKGKEPAFTEEYLEERRREEEARKRAEEVAKRPVKQVSPRDYLPKE